MYAEASYIPHLSSCQGAINKPLFILLGRNITSSQNMEETERWLVFKSIASQLH